MRIAVKRLSHVPFLRAVEQPQWFQISRPIYSSLFRMPVPRRQMPLIADGPHALPEGAGIFLMSSACAILRGPYAPSASPFDRGRISDAP
jgi:hypothetical protein